MNQNDIHDYTNLANYGSNDAQRELTWGNCLTKVYGWMMVALAVSGLVAYKVASSPTMLSRIFNNPILFYALFGVEILMVIMISGGLAKLSSGAAKLLFLGYAALNGITCSAIFVIYTRETLTSAFLVTAATFGATALFGTLYKGNLSVMGRALFMGLIGLIIATIVNIFLKSDGLELYMTYFGVLLFTGLTAYDSWKMKQLFSNYDLSDKELVNRFVIIGALELYLDFINLFIYILRLMSRKK